MTNIIETTPQQLQSASCRLEAIQAKLSYCTDYQKQTLNKIDLRLNNVMNDLETVLIDLEKVGGEV